MVLLSPRVPDGPDDVRTTRWRRCATGYRVITWDERGFGEHRLRRAAVHLLGLWPPTAWPSWSTWGSSGPSLGGMSQGGFVALRAALLAPDAGAGPDPARHPGRDRRTPRWSPLYQGMIDDWVANGPSDDSWPSVGVDSSSGDPGLVRRVDGPVDGPPPGGPGPARAGRLLERESIADRLAEITAPALVVHGTADVADLHGQGRGGWPPAWSGCAGVVAVEGGTHAANMTHPGPVNEADPRLPRRPARLTGHRRARRRSVCRLRSAE